MEEYTIVTTSRSLVREFCLPNLSRVVQRYLYWILVSHESGLVLPRDGSSRHRTGA